MLRVLLLLPLFSLFLFADSFGAFGSRLPIYTIGDVSPVADALNFVAMLANSTAMKTLLTFGVIIALFRLAMKGAAQDGKGAALEFVYIFVVLILFVLPSADVQVLDGRVAKGGAAPPDPVAASDVGYLSAKSVDNIPIGLAAIASASTVFSWDLASVVDTVIAPINGVGQATYLGVTQAGINQPAKDISWIAKNIAKFQGGKNVDDYEYRLHEYVRICALPTVSLNITNAAKIMKPTDGDYKTALSPSSLPVAGTMIIDPVNKGTQMDCSDFWNTYLIGVNATSFEDNVFQQFRDYKKFDANGANTNTEAGLHYLINGTTTSAIANLKDTTSSLRRAAVVASAVDAASTGIDGIDMSNRMAMTSAKQNIMVQGAANFAWLGEMLPMVITLGVAFLIVFGYLMAIFLLFQGWVKGIKVIANYAAGFFALTFSYVSLAVTQGIVNRRAYADAAEHYFSQGSNLQVTNYDFLLEQAATMDGLTGLLGSVFVLAGSAIVFYGESKMLIGGMLGKVTGAYGGNNLDHTLEDNARDNALTDSIADANRKKKMEQKLADAGIPVDGGSIEYEYARFQKELSEIGSARGIHSNMTGGPGATSSDAMSGRIETIAGAAVQSMEKAASLQGYGSQALSMNNGDLEKALDRAHPGALTKGKAAAAASMRESDILSKAGNQEAFIEGTARSAEVKAMQTIGAGVANPSGGMNKYLENMKKEATVGFLAKGVKAEAAGDRGLAAGDNTRLDGDYAEGIYRGEASGIEATKMKARVFGAEGQRIGREDYIQNNAANALNAEMKSQAEGKMVRDSFGNTFGESASVLTPKSEDDKHSSSDNTSGIKIPTTLDIAEDALSGKTLKATIEATGVSPSKEKKESQESGFDSNRPVSVFNHPDKKRAPSQKVDGVMNTMANTGSQSLVDADVLNGEELEKSGIAQVGKTKRGQRVVAYPDGKVKVGGHRNWRNNNPGNIQYGDFAKKHGAIGSDGRFAIFPSMEKGYEAQAALLNTKNYRNKTLAGAISRWAPPSENNTGAYISAVAKKTGISPSTPMHSLSQEQRKGIALAMSQHEGMKAGHVASMDQMDGMKLYVPNNSVASGTGGGSFNYGPMNLAEIHAAYARKNMDQFIAGGQSIANTYQHDPSAYATATAMSEAGALMSAQSVYAKGGLGAAIQMGTMSAAAEGRAEKEAFVGRSTQQLVSQGMNAEDAKKMAESIASGSEKGAEKFKQAIMSAAGAAAKVSAAEQEGLSQAHTKQLRSEFGETLTEKESSASGKTFSEEKAEEANDRQAVKKDAWQKRRDALQKQRDALAMYAGSNDEVTAAQVGSVIEKTIDSDNSLTDTNKKLLKFKAGAITEDLKNGREVTGDRIKDVLGEHTGSSVISALESNGIAFKDAEGVFTGDAIDAEKTGVSFKRMVAGGAILGALDAQEQINEKQWNGGHGTITTAEFEKRQKSIGHLRQSAMDNGNGDMSVDDFVDAGFSKESINELGIKDGKDDYADGYNRMFKVDHIDENAVIGASLSRFDKQIEELDKHAPEGVKPPESKSEENEITKLPLGDDRSVAASRINSVMKSEIDKSALDDPSKKNALVAADVITDKIAKGETVTDKQIVASLGEDLGERTVSAMKQNGVLFDDAEGIGTGDEVKVEETGKRIKEGAANSILMKAVGRKEKENDKLLQDGEISKEEYQSREEALGYLKVGLSGYGGDLPVSRFKEGGFSEQELDSLGVEQGSTDRANGYERMFQVRHLNNDKILANAQQEEAPKEKTEEKKPAPVETQTKAEPASQKPESQSHSWNELAEAQEGKRVKEFIGSGSGIIENVAQNPNVYSENAMYGEMSHASTTQAKLEAQGGIHKAVAVDSAESTIKAATQKGAVAEQAAQLAGGGEDGKKIAEAIKNGSAEGADLLAAGIVRAAQNLGAAQSGARTASDMSQVRETGGKDAFIEAASVEGAKRGVTSKVQNIDVGSEEVANKQVQGILSTTKTEDRQKVLESLKNFGMVTEDSTLDNVQATSGEQFIKGKAAAAAATMSKDDRLSFAGYSYHLSTDSTTGDTRVEATNAQGLTTGRYVHDKTGIKVDNPVQMMAERAGINTTEAYTGTDNNGDGDADGIGSIAGEAAMDIAAAGVAYGGYKAIDGLSGKRISKAQDAIKHKVKGDVKIGDDWYSKQDIPLLEESGVIKKDKDGQYHYEEGKSVKEGRAVVQESFSRPTVSAGAFQTPQTNNTTSVPTNTAAASANMDNSSNINSSEGKNTPFDVSKYNKISDVSQEKQALSAVSDENVGRSTLKSQVKSQKASILEEIQEASASGDQDGVEKASRKLAAANRISKNIDNGLDVTAKDLKAAGMETPHISTEKAANGYVKRVVDFGSLGEASKTAKMAELDAIEQSMKAETSVASAADDAAVKTAAGGNVHESTPHHATADAHAPKSRAGKLFYAVASAVGLGSLFASSAEAAPTPRLFGSADVSGTAPSGALYSADASGMAMQAGFNVLNAAGAVSEIKGGASTNIADLASPKAYTQGFKQIASDAVDLSDLKGVGASFADEGIVEGAKLGGKALGKSAMKKLPFIGLGAGMTFAAQRAEAGDYIGAAMEFASGAVSMIPGVGTAASVAIDAALMKRDYDAATAGSGQTGADKPAPSVRTSQGSSIGSPSSASGGLLSSQEENTLSPVQRVQTVSERVRGMDDAEAGRSYISTVAPASQREFLVRDASAGTLTREKMESAGVPSEISRMMPVNEQGTIDMEATGAMYKEGVGHVAGVVSMPEHPTFKYSENLGNSLNSGKISHAAATAISAASLAENAMPQPTASSEGVSAAETTTVSVQPMQQPAQTTTRTVVQERIVEAAGSSDPLTIQSGGANEVTEFARNATSPGNLQTSSSDLKKSIDEVGAALENARAMTPTVPAEQVSLNAFALNDLASGMALSAPIQTAGGELTLGNKDGFLTLGQGENAIQTPVSSGFLQSAPPEAIDKLASTFSNSRLTNETITAVTEGEVYKGAMGMAGTEEMLYEMTNVNKQGALDSRIQNDDQVTLLEDLVVGIEKMQMAAMPESEKAKS